MKLKLFCSARFKIVCNQTIGPAVYCFLSSSIANTASFYCHKYKLMLNIFALALLLRQNSAETQFTLFYLCAVCIKYNLSLRAKINCTYYLQCTVAWIASSMQSRGFQKDDCIFQRGLYFENLNVQVYYQVS